MRPFSVSEVHLGVECRELRVAGELDLAVVDQLQERLDAAANDGVDVLIRLDRCDFIDSTGLAAIVFAERTMAGRGRRLLLCSPSRAVSRILAITGYDRPGLIYGSTDEALAEGFGAPRQVPE